MIFTWTDISLIFLIGLSIILSLIPLVALYFAWRGMRALNRVLPTKMPRVQSVMWQVHDAVQKGSTQVTEPVIRVKSEWARAETTARTITNLVSRKQPPTP